MKRTLEMVVVVFLIVLATAKGVLIAADIEAVLDDAVGSSAFSVKDSTNTTMTQIDSDGNMVIRGGMRLDSSGVECTTPENLIVDRNVGIGIESPSAFLHIAPTVTSSADVRALQSGTVYNGATAMTNWYGNYISAPTGTGTITNRYGLVTEAGAGNVGIGTTTPQVKLDVAGTVSLQQNALVADFHNGSGVTLVGGDVVIVNTGADLSVTRTTTVGHQNVAGVVVVGGAAGATVKVAIDGIFTVKVTSATSRGNYLRTSGTLGSASTTSSSSAGNFGIALTSSTGAGTVRAMFIKAENF